MNVRTLFALAFLTACGRDVNEADVKFVGVGNDPEEIGPAPTPYGGVVEYDHVDFGGGGLSLAFMGLGGTDPVGPGMAQFAPPYEGVFGFSYIFDQMLPAADNLFSVGGAPPEFEDTCYTVFEPQGPIGSFTTVDVGDHIAFTSTESDARFRLGRFPGEYPPDPQDLFVYYIGLQYHTPAPRTHLVPDGSGGLVEKIYRPRNYPFGEEMEMRFPGGFARLDQPIGSMPVPAKSTITLPDTLGGVLLEWDGPRYDVEGEVIGEGAQGRCFEFYEGRDDGAVREDCDTPIPTPTSARDYASFDGQMYTGPWDSADGAVKFTWAPKEHGDTVALTVRFMAPFDREDPANRYEAVQMPNGEYRPAQACEDGEFVYDADLYESGGELLPSLRGDPFSQRIQVTCLLEDDGEFSLTTEHLGQALEHAEVDPIGGVVFFLSRMNTVEAEVPPVKSRWDQRLDITPVKVVAQTLRIGRFWWEDAP